MTALLEIENLGTRSYTRQGTVKAVDGVDLDVVSGKTLAIVGESGCGKSMTALSLMRLIPIRPGASFWAPRVSPGSPMDVGSLGNADKGSMWRVECRRWPDSDLR